MTGYVENSRKVAAENGLRSIYLMEKDYLHEEGVYYGTGRGDHTAKINTDLFSGNQTLDVIMPSKLSLSHLPVL